MLLSACNGLFSSVYDTPDADTGSEFGFVSAATDNTPGKIYIDATDYERWTYINFNDMSIDTLDVNDPEPKKMGHSSSPLRRKDQRRQRNGGRGFGICG